MRPVDFQNISAQTPGVEKTHQTRPQQPESEQRQYASIVKESEDQKSKEAQATPESRETKVQTEKERERQLNHSKKEKKEKAEKEKGEKSKGVKKDPFRGKSIDITI